MNTTLLVDRHTAVPYRFLVEFIESLIFTRLVSRYMDDDELSALEAYLSEHPGDGKVVPGSGGVRKLRWRAEGRGKRGGIRIIYYWHGAHDEIWLLTLYGKGERETIAAAILKKIVEEMRHG